MSPGRMSAVRALWGCLLLLAPGWVAQRVRWSGGERPPVRTVIRVLGTRQVVQAGVTARWPSHRVLRLGAGTDVLHAATAAAFATSAPGRRAAGGVGAIVAIAFAAMGWRAR